MDFIDPNSGDAFSPDGLRLICLLKQFFPSEVIADLEIGDFCCGLEHDDGTVTLINRAGEGIGRVSKEADTAACRWYVARRVARFGDDLGMVQRLFIDAVRRIPVNAAQIDLATGGSP